MEKILERGLPAPATWLDARAGVVISVAQPPREYSRSLDRETAWHTSSGTIRAHTGSELGFETLAVPGGEVRRACLDEQGSRVVAVMGPIDEKQTGTTVAVWDTAGRAIARREFDDRFGCDATWFRADLAIGACGSDSAGRATPKAELWTSDLEERVDQLVADDPGFEVVAAGDVVVASGFDTHLWWPGGDRAPIRLGEEGVVAPFAHLSGCVLSPDGQLLAAARELTRAGQTQAIVLRVDALDAEPVRIYDGTGREVRRLAFSPDGALLALTLRESPDVRVHRTTDGSLVGDALVFDNTGALAWLDPETLLVGGAETLTAWAVR